MGTLVFFKTPQDTGYKNKTWPEGQVLFLCFVSEDGCYLN